MPTYLVTDPNTGRKLRLTGDTPPTDEDLDEIFSSIQQQPAPAATPAPINIDVPSAEQDKLVSEYYQQQAAKPKPSIAQMLAGVAETGAAMATGGTTGLLGQIAGTVQQAGRELSSGQFGTPEAANRIEQRAADVGASATYSPRTDTGQQYTAALAEMTEPLAGISPLAPQISAAAQPVRSAISARIPARAGARGDIDESLIVDRPEDAQRIATSMSVPAGKKINPAKPTELVNDKLQTAAMRQGFSDNFVKTLRDLSDADRRQVLKMASTIDRGESDFLISRYNRPSDIVGQSLSDRIDYIKSINKKAGKDVDAAVKSLPEVVDPTAPFENALGRLVDMGIKFDNEQKPIFRGSDIQGFGPDEKIVRNVVERMNEVNTAKDLHNLKKYIYNNVYYGKRAEGGIQPKTENVLKQFAKDINDALGEASEDYRNANSVYSETIGALDDLQGAAGGKIDIFGEGADKALGTRMRALLSNQAGRADLDNQVQNIDTVAKKYGGNFKDDIKTQIAIVDELERIYQIQGKTSLGGEFGKQAQEVINKGVRGAITDKAFSMISKSEKQRRQDSLKALKNLLKGQEK